MTVQSKQVKSGTNLEVQVFSKNHLPNAKTLEALFCLAVVDMYALNFKIAKMFFSTFYSPFYVSDVSITMRISSGNNNN
jgi:hypothetical protein